MAVEDAVCLADKAAAADRALGQRTPRQFHDGLAWLYGGP